MDCCADGRPGTALPDRIGRRTVLKGMLATVGGVGLAACGLRGDDGRERIQLAFCGQLLCVVPYELTEHQGFFADEGLDVELVYTRGGNAAMQALVGGAVDYAATSFDVALQAVAEGAQVHRFASTGRLPLFALATAPDAADEISAVEDLQGRTVGVSALGNADHTILMYLLEQAGADVGEVSFATLGTNMYDALRLGQVDAGMVQEPALSLIVEAGGGVLMNAMDIDDATRHLGGPYEFMGVAVRSGEREQRLDQMRRLARALERGLQAVQTTPAAELVDALPSELIAGEDRGRLEAILEQYRGSLYPTSVAIDVDAVTRVIDAHHASDLLERDVDLDELLDLTVLGA